MIRVASIIVALALLLAAIRLAIVAIIVAGLIFRTKETIGLLLIGVLVAFPYLGLGLAVLIISISLVRMHRSVHRPRRFVTRLPLVHHE